MTIAVKGRIYTKRDKWWWCEGLRIEGGMANALDLIAAMLYHSDAEIETWKALATDARPFVYTTDVDGFVTDDRLRWCERLDAMGAP